MIVVINHCHTLHTKVYHGIRMFYSKFWPQRQCEARGYGNIIALWSSAQITLGRKPQIEARVCQGIVQSVSRYP